MTEALLVAFISGMAPSLAVIVTWLLQQRTLHVLRVQSQHEHDQTHAVLEQVHLVVNSRLTEALQTIKELERLIKEKTNG